MSFDTPEGRKDEYLDSCRRVGDRIPDDEEIAAITGYISPKLRVRRLLENVAVIAFALTLGSVVVIWLFYD